ncbi:glutathione S-transferase [Durotheca rogersii]|uniref:glutathione S-transferase n=1 Tax=Durotheca rogersii TaxID=419775 RepID=UPI00221F5EC7|nr:glutathione S-transferase [Durotheca rogersii]KAI5865428.1 glutathione S-transferase [Durotheca rogersii]
MSDIHLYTSQTPNGIKVSILLEELGLKYKVTNIELSKNTQKEPWFLEINPNGRIPALTDTFTDGKLIRLFESGSIMQYLTDRYDTEHKVSYPKGSREYYEVNNWLMWQMGGLGYAPEKIEYGINRYKNETRRLYRTLETQLNASKSGYLVGDRCTSADIASWGWVAGARWAGVDIEEFPLLKQWVERMLKRPGVEKGRNVPSSHPYESHQGLTEEELDEKAAVGRKWIQASMKEDAK